MHGKPINTAWRPSRDFYFWSLLFFHSLSSIQLSELAQTTEGEITANHTAWRLSGLRHDAPFLLATSKGAKPDEPQSSCP